MSSANRTPVKELRTDSQVAGDYQLVGVTTLIASNGNPYVACKISDKSGTLTARMWAADPNKTTCARGSYLAKEGAIVHVIGKGGEYQGRPQVVIDSLHVRVTTSDEDFTQVTRYSVPALWNEMVDRVSRFENAWIRNVAEDILLGQDFAEAVQRSPAATGIHHAFQGGLLEHTVEMSRMADTLLDLPFLGAVLNRDLCVFGVLFHDFGKIFEYSPEAGFKKTVQGALVPRIPMVAAIIYEACKRLGVPEIIRDHMMHIVLAHHGKVEWGSPVEMNIPEAAFVHYIDHMHGDIFGWLQRIESEGRPGVDLVYPKFGKNSLLVERFTDIVKKVEEAMREPV